MAENPCLGAELRQATQSHSLRYLATESGWGRSTIHEWMTDVRVPAESQLDDLLDVVGVDQTVRARLHQLRNAASADPPAQAPAPAENAAARANDDVPDDEAAGTPPPDVPHEPASAVVEPPAAQPVPTRKRGWIAVLAAAALLAVASLGIGIGAALGGGDDDARVHATVVNTGSQGVTKRTHPSRDSRSVGAVVEGTEVTIVCLRNDGERVSSRVQGGRTSRVWALLDDGSWVSDLYLDTEKSWAAPNTPPPPLRACGQ